ncbi:MAG: hypothetical protein KatS3mg119_1936 [Rhodothalassiaceae bacterium]|nr:MAG: hypothetical protein KatS3mg119_1936 [Rhodothalassiaceae bacterium]
MGGGGKRILHFTLGPVQAFVAQARRTQDLWAGSFLLSWLAGHAMKAVVDAHGTVTMPRLTDAKGQIVDLLFAAITGKPLSTAPAPALGSLPNRFRAEVPEGFDPNCCERAVRAAWQRLADAVWERFVKPELASMEIATKKGEESVDLSGALARSREIWDRQVVHFWEMAWVIGDESSDGPDGAWLDRRKNWRSHRPPDEPGDHCMLIGDLQELSGIVRAKERDKQDAFWQRLRWQIVKQTKNPLDLEEGERLSAIALIKRLFLHVAPEVLGWTPAWDAGETGAEETGNRADEKNKRDDKKGEDRLKWPSTPRIAATGWLVALDEAIRKNSDNTKALAAAAKEYAVFVDKLNAGCREPGLDDDRQGGRFKLATVAGHLLHESGVDFAAEEELRPRKKSDSRDPERDIRPALRDAYTALKDAAGNAGCPAGPSSFYALLLMDGDSVGKLIRERGGVCVARALADFSAGVDGIVRRHLGRTVYAGGDDVLALLPLEGAIPAAVALKQAYRAAFGETCKDGKPTAGDARATISGAIVFAHFRVPLYRVIEEAHHQLEDVAKEGNGRDSLALAVLTPSGRTRQAVGKWWVREGDNKELSPPRRLQELAADPGRRLPGSFLHNIRARLAALEGERAFDDIIAGVIRGEFRRARTGDKDGDDQETQLLCHLLALARHYRPGAGGLAAQKTSEIRTDPSLAGPLLAHFLQGEWRLPARHQAARCAPCEENPAAGGEGEARP